MLRGLGWGFCLFGIEMELGELVEMELEMGAGVEDVVKM